jgi:ferredoxin
MQGIGRDWRAFKEWVNKGKADLHRLATLFGDSVVSVSTVNMCAPCIQCDSCWLRCPAAEHSYARQFNNHAA